MELEIKETGSTAQATILKTTATALAIALSQVPIQIQYSEPVATPVAKLTKQTGTHSISTSNGFAGNDNIDAILANLSSFGIEVSIDNDVMIFTNTTSQDIEITMQAQGRSGKLYVPIEQENTSINIDGKNVSFTLKAKQVDDIEELVELPMLNHIVVPDNIYTISYRIDGGEVQTVNGLVTSDTDAQTILVNLLAYSREINQHLAVNVGQGAFWANYNHPIQGAFTTHNHVIRTERHSIDFLLTPNAENDLIKLIFGKNIRLISHAVVNWDYWGNNYTPMPEPPVMPDPEPPVMPDPEPPVMPDLVID